MSDLPEETPIGSDDALLWLHDRVGLRMVIDVRSGPDEPSRSIVSALGELRHWSTGDDPFEGGVGEAVREVMLGMFVIGERCDFDVNAVGYTFAVRKPTQSKPARASDVLPPDATELVLRLDPYVEIWVAAAEHVLPRIALDRE
jgi:hypothetical protein